MANRTNSLFHTKWVCKYHIVFVAKYRRKIIYNQYRADLQGIMIFKRKEVDLLAEMIAEKKAEIAAEKAKMKTA